MCVRVDHCNIQYALNIGTNCVVPFVIEACNGKIVYAITLSYDVSCSNKDLNVSALGVAYTALAITKHPSWFSLTGTFVFVYSVPAD